MNRKSHFPVPSPAASLNSSAAISRLIAQGFTESLYLFNGNLFCNEHPYWSCAVQHATWETFLDRDTNKWLFAITHGDIKGILCDNVPSTI